MTSQNFCEAYLSRLVLNYYSNEETNLSVLSGKRPFQIDSFERVKVESAVIAQINVMSFTTVVLNYTVTMAGLTLL